MTVVFQFPGQGSQAVGMGRAFAETSGAARGVFAEANDALGFDLKRLIFDGPESELTLTANPQPAVLTASVAAAAACGERGLRPDLAAGHSLGEYSALVVAGGPPFAGPGGGGPQRGGVIDGEGAGGGGAEGPPPPFASPPPPHGAPPPPLP